MADQEEPTQDGEGDELEIEVTDDSPRLQTLLDRLRTERRLTDSMILRAQAILDEPDPLNALMEIEEMGGLETHKEGGPAGLTKIAHYEATAQQVIEEWVTAIEDIKLIEMNITPVTPFQAELFKLLVELVLEQNYAELMLFPTQPDDLSAHTATGTKDTRSDLRIRTEMARMHPKLDPVPARGVDAKRNASGLEIADVCKVFAMLLTKGFSRLTEGGSLTPASIDRRDVLTIIRRLTQHPDLIENIFTKPAHGQTQITTEQVDTYAQTIGLQVSPEGYYYDRHTGGEMFRRIRLGDIRKTDESLIRAAMPQGFLEDRRQ